MMSREELEKLANDLNIKTKKMEKSLKKTHQKNSSQILIQIVLKIS